MRSPSRNARGSRPTTGCGVRSCGTSPATTTSTRCWPPWSGRSTGRPGATGADDVLSGPWVRALLAGQRDDGGFGGTPYSKWTGAHWRLVSLVELAVPAGEPRAVAAAGTVLDWLTGDRHRRSVKVI